jgi:hypothetical protein
MTLKDWSFAVPPNHNFKRHYGSICIYISDPIGITEDGMRKLSKNRDFNTVLWLVLVNISSN